MVFCHLKIRYKSIIKTKSQSELHTVYDYGDGGGDGVCCHDHAAPHDAGLYENGSDKNLFCDDNDNDYGDSHCCHVLQLQGQIPPCLQEELREVLS